MAIFAIGVSIFAVSDEDDGNDCFKATFALCKGGLPVMFIDAMVLVTSNRAALFVTIDLSFDDADVVGLITGDTSISLVTEDIILGPRHLFTEEKKLVS
jgi:hypothetical protein